MTDTPTILADYRPPTFAVDQVDLTFELAPRTTIVRSRLSLRRNTPGPLTLDGEALHLRRLLLDGEPLERQRYAEEPNRLVIADVPDSFTLDIETLIDPSANTELSGLYLSQGAFFTQCEAEGFRRITFFPDRPDVMARYTTTIVAPRDIPVLLSNGNPVDTGETADGRHWAKWEDPHPKPCYLFALVAGDLVALRDRFVTAAGRDVALAIWVRHGDEDKCGHAMRALKAAMAWDERVFGLLYDLDVFNIAAVSDFNMGAMENKGLNVFNTKYVLAKPETATDADFQGIDTVIAHEYFHNWTGNRVTCRDWFQLSLKEGLTVFRDQEFTADQGSRAVKRIADVRRLRAAQFSEDAGPLAHAVRPASYLKIDNFYTATIYQKGAEICRMLHTLLTPSGFRRGMDLYIARHDNQAATIEQFLAAMDDANPANGIDFAHFARWYEQPGTPVLHVADDYDATARRYTLTLGQRIATQSEAAPLLIPVAMALLDADGQEHHAAVLTLSEAERSYVFEDVGPCTPSLLRGFSAPVRLEGLAPSRLGFLATHDPDAFVRWDSGQHYAGDWLLAMVAARAEGRALTLDPGLLAALDATLDSADPAFAAEALTLPGEASLADRMTVIDVDGIHAVRQWARAEIGRTLDARLRAAHRAVDRDEDGTRVDGEAAGRRALKSVCLAYLAAAGETALVQAQFDGARNMTDRLAALALLAARTGPSRDAALAAFHAAFRHDDLVLDKWFAIQAASHAEDTVARVEALARHPDFAGHNPNRVRALIGTYAMANPVRFHVADGAGYDFFARQLIALDAINGQVAARLVPALGTWRRHDDRRQTLMRAALERIRATSGLSGGTAEMVDRSLG